MGKGNHLLLNNHKHFSFFNHLVEATFVPTFKFNLFCVF